MKELQNMDVLVFFACLLAISGKSIPEQNDQLVKSELKTLYDWLTKRENCEKLVKERTVYLNGIIYTVDVAGDPNWDENPKDAIVVDDGIIAYVGSNCEAEKLLLDLCVTSTKVYDLDGTTVLPGMHDVHMHPLEAKSPTADVCRLPSSVNPEDEEMAIVLEECPSKQEGTDWIIGHGHSIVNMLHHINELDGRPPRVILDHFIKEDPAVMLEETSHSVWVNSEALKRAGIGANTPERPGGIIMREKDSNLPNGILFENEGMRIMALAMAPNDALDKQNYEGLLEALDELKQNGITSICDARLFWKSGHHKAWDKACDVGKLKVRTILDLWAYPHENDDTQIEELKAMYSEGRTGCSLRKTQIKLYSDGLLQSTTAAMLKPYEFVIGLPGMEANTGMNYFNESRTQKYIEALQDLGDGKGYDFHIHAIGDRGVHETLNAIENAHDDSSDREPRHRITHLEVINPDDIDRFRELGVIADFQVAGQFSLPDMHGNVEWLIGKERAKLSIPVKSVVGTQATTTFSSDWDVNDLNPFVGMQHATMRDDQSVTIKTAVEMYTINAAYAMRQEGTVGSLVKGKEADFIIIDQDVLSRDYRDVIRYTEVLATVFKGEEIFRRYEDFPEEYGENDYYECI